MILRIDETSPTPPYEQIRSQIATMAASGVLPPGKRLPAIRQLSADLGLAGGTVARAYRELEQAGVIATKGRHGTFVRAQPRPKESGADLGAAARSFAIQAKQMGVPPEAALDSLKRAFEAIGSE